ncbi:MAG: TIGR00730 family Rossman fold protein [Rhodospirillales bacterium]|nr:MAG: TIGR00730 family Rossman fold protein [Rhodospirillales bacterium]
MKKRERPGAFPSARQDEEAARHFRDTPQTRSPSYRLAFADPDFLLREDLRPVRLQLELLKPELALQEADIVSTIVVFGSARTPPREGPAADERMRDYEEARRFARLMSERERNNGLHSVIVTGGGPGIMEAANRGARESGARTIGLNIVLPHEQAPNPYITPELSFQFHYFAIRKMHFLMRARALVCFPGGFGTLDELFETLTLIQTGKIEPIPVLLFREAWWRRIVNFEAIAEAGMIAPEDLEIFQFVETAEAACDLIDAFYGKAG